MRLVRALAIAGMCVSLSGCVIVVRGNVSSSGVTGNDGSYLADLSADGRYLVFTSFASNLVPNDNTPVDVFVRDRVTGTTERVSIGDAEQEGDGGTPGQAYPDAISADGRYVLFSSYSSNLVDNVDDNGVADLFVRDRVAGTTKLVSVAVDGTSGNAGTYVGGSLSNDGRYVAFSSNATDLVAGSHAGNDLYVRDLQSETTTDIALPGPVDDVWNVTLSGDGNVVAFNSPQHHVPGDNNGGIDTFVYDRTTGQTERVSVDSNENESVATGGAAEFNDVAINDDGSVVAFVTPYSGLVAGDDNGTNDVFVRDRNAGTTERVSVTSSGGQATGESGIGVTTGSNIDLDSTGRRVLFLSEANDLVPGDTGNTDVFLHDRQTAKTTRVSTDRLERNLNGPSSDAAIDGTGRIVGFTSQATNVVTPDPNSVADDIFLRSAVIPTVASVSPSSGSRGTQFVLTIQGSGFLSGTTAAISGLGFTVVPVVVSDEDTIEVTVTIAPDAPLGARNVFVSLGVVASGGLGFAVAVCPGCFTVTT